MLSVLSRPAPPVFQLLNAPLIAHARLLRAAVPLHGWPLAAAPTQVIRQCRKLYPGEREYSLRSVEPAEPCRGTHRPMTRRQKAHRLNKADRDASADCESLAPEKEGH